MVKMSDQVHRYTFNVLAKLLRYGNVINIDSSSKDECEKTINILETILQTMKNQIEKMED